VPRGRLAGRPYPSTHHTTLGVEPTRRKQTRWLTAAASRVTRSRAGNRHDQYVTIRVSALYHYTIKYHRRRGLSTR